MNIGPLEEFEVPNEESPKVMDDPEFSAVSSYLLQKCEHWIEKGNPKNVCTSREMPMFKKVFESLRATYDDMHVVPMPRDAKEIVQIYSLPDSRKERREYGFVSVIFCDADLMLKISDEWYVATKEQALRGIVVSGAFDPILPSITYKCVGEPTLLTSLSLEPAYTYGESRKSYQDTPRNF